MHDDPALAQGDGWLEYASDKVGRTTAIGDATGFGSQTSFASGIGYRAFGGVQAMTYSTTTETSVSVSYDNLSATPDK